MKVAVWHNLPSGGGKRALYYHVKGLLERGHRVECWCPDRADVDYLPLSELTTEHVVPLNAPPASAGFERFLPWSLCELRRARRRMRNMQNHCHVTARQIEQFAPDILFANTCRDYAAPFIGRCVSGPSVLYLQEPARRFYEARPILPWVATNVQAHDSHPIRLRKLCSEHVRLQVIREQALEEYQNVHSYDRVLANSFFSRESLLRAYGINAHVCYLGVDTDLFQFQGAEKENYVITVGSLSVSKSAERAIEALARLPEDSRPELLWIANSVNDEARQQAELLAAERRVKFNLRSGIGDDELVKCLSRARLMLYAPSLEPFGFAPLEANACGTFAVSVKEGGVRETIENGVNGWLAENPDPACLADVLREALACADLVSMDRRVALRRHVVDHWSLNAATARLEEVLFKVSNKRAP